MSEPTKRNDQTFSQALASTIAGIAGLVFLWWLLGSPPLDRVLENVLAYFHALGDVLGS